MQMLPTFPAVPSVVAGQVLSAATLNSYHEGLRYLLGISKGSESLQTATTNWRSLGSTEGTIWGDAYGPLVGWTLYYNLWFKGSWSWKIQVYGNDSTWHDVTSGSGSGDGHPEGTVSLSGLSAYLTLGVVYAFRVRASGSGGGAVWALRVRPALTGWVTPPTFASGVTSSANALNTLRGDLVALDNWLPGYSSGVTGTAGAGYGDVNLWHTFWRGSFRWKPHMGVYCSMEAKGYVPWGSQFTWGVELNLPERSGEYWTSVNLYTVDITAAMMGDQSQYQRYEVTLDYTKFPAMTTGTYYTLTYWVRFTTVGTSINVRRPIAHRVAQVAPEAGWPTLTEWAEGDYVTHDRLNAISAGLNNLNAGGANALWPEVSMSASEPTAFVHTKPWLVVRATPGTTITVYYPGEIGSYTESFTVQAEPEGVFTSIYLDRYAELTYSTRYLVQGATWAAEADEAYAP